ncbi:MAG: hypothetical protein ACK4F7_03090 [Inhella sp.]
MQVVRIEVAKELLGVARLAQLLEAVERSGNLDAVQYRALVKRLQQALQAVASHAGLGALLDHFPAASQVYENLQYEVAGLCRAPLDAAVSTETAARELIARARVAG